MKQIFYGDVEGLDSKSLGIEGSSKMIIRILSEDTLCIEIEPEGYTPDHAHQDKERVFIINGKGEARSGEDKRHIKTGDFVEFENHEKHQIINNSDEKLILMCLRNQN